MQARFRVQGIPLCLGCETPEEAKAEASCLAVAVRRNYKLSTDDKDARQWAKRLKIPHTDTLRILAMLVRIGAITLPDGNSSLKKMIDTGYHSPMTELDGLIE